MKKRIFEKSEDGNFIINFANVDFDYYSKVANSDTAEFDTGSFIVLSFFSSHEKKDDVKSASNMYLVIFILLCIYSAKNVIITENNKNL